MESKLELLTVKIEKLIDTLESLQQENNQLKGELSGYKKDYENLKLTSNDKNDGIKTKLTTILNRLEQLEDLAS